MRLATILTQGMPCVVLVDAERSLWWPLADVLPGLPRDAGTDMSAAIAHIAAAGASADLPGDGGQDLAGTVLLPPITRPPHNILCVGKNYRAHAHEFARSGFDATAAAAEAVPEHPIIFTKPASSLAGMDADIPLWPGLDQAVDYEAELAVVIGKGGRFIPRAQAADHIFGYTILNDVTARDLQRQHKQWFLGKGIDAFGPMGPWLVTADEVDAANLRLTCTVNGELRQDATTADLIFDVPTLIEVISRSMTLQPGDIIATGTPEGVGLGFDPPRFLRDGDVVEIEVEGIGRLRNTVRRKSPADNIADAATGGETHRTPSYV